MKRFLVYGLSNNWGGVEAIITSIIIRLQDTCLFDIIVSNGICSYEDKYIAENVKFIHTDVDNISGCTGMFDTFENHEENYWYFNKLFLA